MTRVICWFSCGVTSAIASKMALDKYPDAILAYCDTGSEHPENKLFIERCERWLKKKITVLKSDKYQDIWDVFEKTKYLVGPSGARCTAELKKKVRRSFEHPDDLQVFGFDKSEKRRARRFNENNPEVLTWYPLIEAGMSKTDCLEALNAADIEVPKMYRLGYRNNNCIGCVKGQAGYWNKIRKDFPEVFDRMAKIERKLNISINRVKTKAGGRKKVFLDELDPKAGGYRDLDIQCGLFCGKY